MLSNAAQALTERVHTRQAFSVRSDSTEAALRSRRSAPSHPLEGLPPVLAVRIGAFVRPSARHPVARDAVSARCEGVADARNGTAWPCARFVPKPQDSHPRQTRLARCGRADELSGRNPTQGGSVSGRVAAPGLGDDGLKG